MKLKCGKTLKSCVALAASLCIVFTTAVPCFADDAKGTVETAKPSIGIALNDDIQIFQDYLKNFPDAQYPNAEISVNSESAVVTAGETVSFPVEVEKAGFYSLFIKYCVLEESSQKPAVSFLINGEVPYYEAYTVSLNQTFVDDLSDIESVNGQFASDYVPPQIFKQNVHSEYVYDTSGYYGKRLMFYLDENIESLSISGQVGEIRFDEICFKQYSSPSEYSEIENSDEDYNGETIYFEAETVKEKSSSSIYPINDSSSPAVSPTSATVKLINAIGGSYWEEQGEYVAWNFEVPEDGYYNITFKYMQNVNVGMSSVRRITIDDEVQFEELEEYAFNYTSTYKNETLSADGKDIKFYLKKGSHTLKMYVTLGELSEILSYLNLTMNALSEDYRKVVMLTGTNVDTARDYNLEKYLPEVIESFKEKSASLKEMCKKLEQIMGGNSNGTKVIQTIADQLEECSEDGFYITQQLSSIKSNISAVNSWLIDAKSQPLKLDYFALSSPVGKVKKASAGFFKSVKYHIESFLFTFSSDYSQNSISNSDDVNEITVWTTGNSTSYNILKQQIEKDFEKKNPDIKVNLRLSPGDFNMAVLSGKGPDVASGDVMTLAFRNRVVNLAEFEDFEEIKARFRDSAFSQLKWEDKYYALPISQNINLTYYRTDILEELGLEVPKTWDDVTQVMAELQKNNLEMGVNGFFDDILYQNGGSYYNEDLSACALDSIEAIESFTQYCSYFTEYDAPITYDQLNRFRSGEMPIIFAGFNFSTTLLNLATEISGKWAVAEIPCTLKEDGTYDHSTMSTSDCWFILNEDKKDAAWEYLKWITSTDVIVENVRLNVAALDETVRTCPANVEAFYKVGWPEEMLRLARLHEDGRLKTVPAVPGSYMLTRNYNFAFSNVLFDDYVPANALKSGIKAINAEITRKRKEFGFEN